MKLRPSTYNVILSVKREDEEVFFVWNSLRESAAIINDELLSVLKKPSLAKDKEDLEFLIDHGFLVEKEIDERRICYAKWNFYRFSSRILNLVILPTLKCNLQCPYCYQGLDKSGFEEMNLDTCEKLVEWVNGVIDGFRGINVVWYGGEPLLNWEAIEFISNELSNISGYSAGLITNGVLLERFCDEISDLGIEWVQVTLEVPPERHSSRRTMNGESVLDSILRGIESILGKGLKVLIRLNLDERDANEESLKSTINFLKELDFLKEERGKEVFLSIAPIRYWYWDLGRGACYPELQIEEENRFREFSRRFRSEFPLPATLPSMRTSVCTATHPWAYTVLPNGSLGKCWEKVTSEEGVVGSIREGVNFYSKELMKFLCYDATSLRDCKECPLLPSCFGACANHRLINVPTRVDCRKEEILGMLTEFARKKVSESLGWEDFSVTPLDYQSG
ncbi:hypothetical protein DRN52_01405 [Thermococci archaeon]|nr:MAG: hypothetical protein DRN52_01405 [Thermococci archaeon]